MPTKILGRSQKVHCIVNVNNIKLIIPELFSENWIRGRSLFGRSIMKAQASSLPFTPAFAALISTINFKLPQLGQLGSSIVRHSITKFIAHLANQQLLMKLSPSKFLFFYSNVPRWFQQISNSTSLSKRGLGENSDEESGSEDSSDKDESEVEAKEGIENQTGTNLVNG
ncbi:hypothetical protein BT96DRAFT_948376 [Gymnopus androsaceus JB14]|uniref:Uncharacterized protein n=1 Tax=Gymnopus androsaceus JB14 TaxID=1447944 RepID=A0A6A4GPQ5_9AGAR|nr:hypothetical protein BT96DRAFT_948376 [Gymnopus androsaceus JB14]